MKSCLSFLGCMALSYQCDASHRMRIADMNTRDMLQTSPQNMGNLMTGKWVVSYNISRICPLLAGVCTLVSLAVHINVMDTLLLE